MQITLLTSVAVLLSSAACYPLVRWSSKLKLTAQPRSDRWHKSVTPNTGGLGIFAASTICFLLFAPSGYDLLALCSASIAALGFLDDRLELPPFAKLLGQTAAAVLLVAGEITLPLSPWYGLRGALTVIWIVGITNAFNLIDNMDGLCSGVVAIIAASGASLALLRGDGDRARLFVILLGASAGFLVYNYKPARIFMGDCGSMFLGFSLAALAVIPTRPGAPSVDSLYALPAFLYPVFDTVFVSISRRRAGKPISVGGRDHSSHRLVAVGMSERGAVWLLWAVAVVCASCGPLLYLRPAWLLVTLSALIAFLIAFGRGLSPHVEISMANGNTSDNHHASLRGQAETGSQQA